MISDIWFYVVAVPAVLIVGISKGGFGGGLGTVAVPLMSLAVAPPQAAAVLLPILCAMDLIGVRLYRGAWHAGHARILVPAALVGIALGTAAFRFMDETMIRLVVGGIAVTFALDHWLRPGERAGASGPDVLRGGFWGCICGFTSFIAHAGGPPLSVYLLPQRLDKRVFVGTTVILFIVVNYAKILPYAWLGQLDATNLATSLVLLPLAPVGMGLGVLAHRHVPEGAFYAVCHALLFATGVKLLYDGITGLG